MPKDKQNTFPAQVKIKQSPSATSLASLASRSAPARFRSIHRSATTSDLLDQLQHDNEVRYKAADIAVKSAWSISKRGLLAGEIHHPQSVCFLKDGLVAISEGKTNPRLQIFNAHGQSTVIIDKSVDKDMLHPAGICGAMGGQFLLATDTREVCIYNCRGKPLDRRSMGRSSALKAIAPFGDNKFVVVDAGTRPSVTVSDIRGKTITRFRDDFVAPCHLATDPATMTTCVSDQERRIVSVFDKNGKGICVLGNHANHGPALLWPMGLAFNERGNILVADQASHVVSEYDISGRYLHDVIDREDGIRNPVGLACDGKGGVAITSSWYDYRRNEVSLQVYRTKKTSAALRR